MSSATAPSSSGAVMTQRQITVVILGLMSGMLLGALDQTIVGTSIRTIGDDLHGLSLQAWVTTAYLITSTIMTPIYGKLSDLFGRRPLFIIAIVIFLAGSLLSSFAWSMYSLAVFRAIQGLGAGGLMSLPLAIMGDMLAPRQRAKYQGYFLAVFGVSSVIGPLIGGLFAGASQILFLPGWRWVFLINMPVGVVALFLVVRFLHLPAHTARKVRIDWFGATAVIVSLVPLLLVAEQGRTWGWGSVGSWACYVIGAVGVVAFILIERSLGDDALIPMKLFKSATFSMATVLGVLVGFAMFGALLTLPLYLQLVLGMTPTISGLALLPVILGLMLASILSGQIISRTGKYRIFPITGTAFLSVGYLYLSFIKFDWSYWQLAPGMFLVGFGLGQLMQTLTIASQNSVGARDMGVATSGSTFFRQIGGTLGTAVIFSIVYSVVGDKIAGAFGTNSTLRAALNAALNPKVAGESQNKAIMSKIYDKIVDPIKANLPSQVDLSNAAQRHTVVNSTIKAAAGKFSTGSGSTSSSLDGDTAFLTHASKALSAPFTIGFTESIVIGYYVALGVALLAFVLSFFLKTPPLRQKSAMQEAADQASQDEDDEIEAALGAQRAGNMAGALVDAGTGSIRIVSDGGRPRDQGTR